LALSFDDRRLFHSIADALLHVDMAFQYGEDNEVKIRDFDEPEEDGD